MIGLRKLDSFKNVRIYEGIAAGHYHDEIHLLYRLNHLVPGCLTSVPVKEKPQFKITLLVMDLQFVIYNLHDFIIVL